MNALGSRQLFAVAALLIVAIPAVVLATPPAKPGAKPTVKVDAAMRAGKVDPAVAADVAAIARQVRRIERQAATYRKVRIGPMSELSELTNCCTCCDGSWTAYFDKGRLRKAVIYTGEGITDEFYFNKGRLIFVFQTDKGGEEGRQVEFWARYYLKNGRVMSATANRPPRHDVQLMNEQTLRKCEKAILDTFKRRASRPRPAPAGVLT